MYVLFLHHTHPWFFGFHKVASGIYDPDHVQLCFAFVFLCSYFSPLLKSITSRPDVDYIRGEEAIECRDDFIAQLEARFLFLAADARHTLRLGSCVQSRISI